MSNVIETVNGFNVGTISCLLSIDRLSRDLESGVVAGDTSPDLLGMSSSDASVDKSVKKNFFWVKKENLGGKFFF